MYNSLQQQFFILFYLSMLKIISINLNGIRAATRKGLYEWLQKVDADFICMQELKAQVADLNEQQLNPENYQGYFECAEKKGYSGVGIYSKHKPNEVIYGLGVPEFDIEGRYIELVFDNLSVISLYLPSGTSGDHRQEIKYKFMDLFYKHLEKLMASGREVVICGDWNIAHNEIDLKNWRGNRKNSGFLPEEREWLTDLFTNQGWVDTYRSLYPQAEGEAYTWWSNRGQAWANNTGWRIDYHITTPKIASTAIDASVYKDERFSDHAPLTINYDFSLS